jgi:hypothetical protein
MGHGPLIMSIGGLFVSANRAIARHRKALVSDRAAILFRRSRG